MDDIREHLLCDGIKKNYTMWIWHGELTDMQRGSQSEPFDVEMGDHLKDMIRDLGQESFQQAHAPMYDTLQIDSKKPLYLGCKNSLRLLSVVLSLVNVKARYGWSDKSFSSLLQVVHDMLPEENMLPKSYYQAKKILCPMSMDYKKIHTCPNDCILHIHEFEEMHKCNRCGVSRYKVKDYDEYSSDENSKKGPQRRCCGIFQSFQGLSVYLLIEMMQKT